jgi:hypothetical protein
MSAYVSVTLHNNTNSPNWFTVVDITPAVPKTVFDDNLDTDQLTPALQFAKDPDHSSGQGTYTIKGYATEPLTDMQDGKTYDMS